MIVLDASAWLKLVLRHEPHAEKVQGLVAAHGRGEGRIAVPYVAWAEALFVLRDRMRFPWSDLQTAIRVLSFPRLLVIPPTRRLLLASAAVGERYSISNPDTVYVAAAALRGSDLVTADEPLAARMSAQGVTWVHVVRDYCP